MHGLSSDIYLPPNILCVDTLTKYILPRHSANGAVVFAKQSVQTWIIIVFHISFLIGELGGDFDVIFTSVIVIVSVSYFLVGKKLSASNDLFKQQTNGKSITLDCSDFNCFPVIERNELVRPLLRLLSVTYSHLLQALHRSCLFRLEVVVLVIIFL